MLKSALLVTASMVIGAGSVQLLRSVNAATGPSAYEIYEANITDEAAYTKACRMLKRLSKKLAASASLAVSTRPNSQLASRQSATAM